MTALAHLKPLEYPYKGQIVEFDLTDGVMINATEMARIFSKKPEVFLRKKSTKRLIAFWAVKLNESKVTNHHLALPENALLPLESGEQDDVLRANQADYDPRILQVRWGGDTGGQTWMCRKLAIKFAAWLDVEFEDWLLDILDSLLFGPMGQHLTMMREIATLTNQREALLQQAIPNPIQQQVSDLNRQIRHLNRRLAAAKGQQLDMLRQLNSPQQAA